MPITVWQVLSVNLWYNCPKLLTAGGFVSGPLSCYEMKMIIMFETALQSKLNWTTFTCTGTAVVYSSVWDSVELVERSGPAAACVYSRGETELVWLDRSPTGLVRLHAALTAVLLFARPPSSCAVQRDRRVTVPLLRRRNALAPPPVSWKCVTGLKWLERPGGGRGHGEVTWASPLLRTFSSLD